MRTTTSLLATLAVSTSLVACADDAEPQPDLLALPGQAYYPESLHAAADGTLYIGSLATGSVVAFDDGALEPRTVIAPGDHGVTGVTGVLVEADELWLCSVDTTFQRATEVRSFTLAGQPIATYPMAATQFCNDLAFDATGNLYATDSFSGTIQRLEAGGVGFETYVEDPRFVPDTQGAFGLDGIAIIGETLYVNKFDTGELFAIDADRSITDLVTLVAPDGMRAHEGALLVVEGAGRLTRVALDGTTTTLAEDLDMPTSVVVSRGSAWVSEGQLGRLFANPAQAPNLPFAVRRIDM
jgi:sugar lactone lactonase YvrE